MHLVVPSQFLPGGHVIELDYSPGDAVGVSWVHGDVVRRIMADIAVLWGSSPMSKAVQVRVRVRVRVVVRVRVRVRVRVT